MSAKRFTPGGGAGKSFKLVWNSTPCWALVSCAKVANSGPPGPEAPVLVVDGNDVMNEMEQEDSDTAKDEKRGRKKKGSGVSKKVTQLHSNCKECSLHMVQSTTKSQISNKQHQQTHNSFLLSLDYSPGPKNQGSIIYDKAALGMSPRSICSA